jgi:Protein of unknown function (DUF1592)/Protein of unknown function (DUF1588)/Protein of unknown function (DUF1595)/Protein of unknown function (DUF1585)/Protein of unknown function (DUF1587)
MYTVAMATRKTALLAALGLLVGFLGACAGQVSSSTGGPANTGAAGSTSGAAGSTSGSGTGTAGGSGTGAGTAGVGGAAAPSSLLNLSGGAEPIARLHKLTSSEFSNSLHDLLGAGAPVSMVEPDVIAAGFASVGASTVAMSPSGVGLYEDATGAATDYAFSDPTRAAAVLSCIPTGTTDTACASKALAAFGRRAFRRPLTADETTRFVTLAMTIAAKAGGTVLGGMRHAVWAMLQSPSFLYRVELGAASAADAGRLKYSDFENASRLAATLWGSVPDDTLLDAAAQGKLSAPADLRAQATRMLADPRVHRSLSAFVDDLYGKLELSEAIKDPALFPAWTPTLRDAMQEELERRIDDVVFTQKGDFLALYESKATFVNNELATYYGLPTQATDSWRAATFPADSPRAGLLGAGAILAGFALPQRTSPTARGRFVVQNLLCETVPDPPPGIPPLPAMAGTTSTLRQKLELHRAAASCAACHALMDPLGFGMETFDSAGQYRTKDNGQPIDATGSVDGAAFNGLAELGAAIHKHAVTGACMVSKLYTFAEGRKLNGHDAPALDGLATAFAKNGNHVDQLLLDLVSSDGFRFVTPDQ